MVESNEQQPRDTYQLANSISLLTELEQIPASQTEHLDSVVVLVGYYDVTERQVDANTGRAIEHARTSA